MAGRGAWTKEREDEWGADGLTETNESNETNNEYHEASGILDPFQWDCPLFRRLTGLAPP